MNQILSYEYNKLIRLKTKQKKIINLSLLVLVTITVVVITILFQFLFVSFPFFGLPILMGLYFLYLFPKWTNVFRCRRHCAFHINENFFFSSPVDFDCLLLFSCCEKIELKWKWNENRFTFSNFKSLAFFFFQFRFFRFDVCWIDFFFHHCFYIHFIFYHSE